MMIRTVSIIQSFWSVCCAVGILRLENTPSIGTSSPLRVRGGVKPNIFPPQGEGCLVAVTLLLH